jgi:hypothetical protein
MWTTDLARAALVALMLAAPAAAETAFVGPDMSRAKAQPEDLKVFDDRMRMGARVTFKVAKDLLAREVEVETTLRLELGFITSADVAPDRVRLRCEAWFVGPDNTVGERVMNRICWQGSLGDVAGQWVPMAKGTLDFLPQAEDANGTWGVHVVVTDERTGRQQSFLPTWRWTGGQG